MLVHVFIFLLVVGLLLSLTLLWRLCWFYLRPCTGYLGHPFKNMDFETENDHLSPACKHRRVGVQSEVVISILMHG